ncbi:MAG: endonuclease/exonuclease/phosphatase family protein [Thermoleophilia bacterium]
MHLLARTWNVFHGRTVPAGGGERLERMVRLAAGDRPDVLALQEVPVWALPRLAAWSGMRACWAVARPALAGPAARTLTALAPGLVRSGLTGQANALLLGERIEPTGRPAALRLTPPWPRAGGEPRVVQAVPARFGDRELLVAHAHLAHAPPSSAAGQLLRTAAWLEARADGAAVVLLGDLNLAPGETDAFARLEAAGWSRPGPWIDHVLARGLVPTRGPEAWPDARRRDGERLLSDHRPVEADMMPT